MKSFAKTIKLFLKSPQIILAYLVLLGVSNVFFSQLYKAFVAEYEEWGDKGTDSLFFLSDMGYLCCVFFVFWVFISYEFFRKSKEAGIQENLDCLGVRGSIFYLHQLGTLMLAVLIFTANVGAYMVVGYFQLHFPPVLTDQIYQMLAINVFLLSVGSVFCGSAISQIRNRFAGYGAALALSFLMIWELLGPIAEGLGQGGNVLHVMRAFLCFLPPDTQAYPDALYGLPFESYRVAIIGIWIVLGSIWILRKMCIRSKNAMTVAACICVVLLAGLGERAWNRGSVLLQGDSPQSALMECLIEGEEPEDMARMKPAEFEVAGYRMELRIRKELSAICRVELAESATNRAESSTKRAKSSVLREYAFTLYHCYKVKDVQDEKGRKMEFRQEGDYVIVKGNGEMVKEITFYYEGGSNFIYSNSHACFLTGIVPWYPKAGFQEFTKNRCVEWLGEPLVSFDIGLDIPGEVVSNLECSEGRYKGKTDNALFVKGYLDAEYYKKTNMICYPMQRASYRIAQWFQEGKLQQTMDQWMEYLGAPKEQITKKKVICIPESLAFGSRMNQYYETDSYILAGTGISPRELIRWRLEKKGRSELTDIFYELLPLEDFQEVDVSDLLVYKEIRDPENYDKADVLHDMVIQKIKDVGMQEIMKRIYARVMAEDYERDLDADLEFVENLPQIK